MPGEFSGWYTTNISEWRCSRFLCLSHGPHPFVEPSFQILWCVELSNSNEVNQWCLLPEGMTGTGWMIIIHTAEMRPFVDDSPQSNHHSSGLSSTQTLAVAWRAKIPWIRSSGIHSWVISLVTGKSVCPWPKKGSSKKLAQRGTHVTPDDPTQKGWPRGI